MIRTALVVCKPGEPISSTAAHTPLWSSRLESRPVGSSGMKRKGRQHQPKVGTPQERRYAQRQSERAVAGNMGIQGRGWVMWTAIAVLFVIGLIAAFGILFW